LTKFLDYDTIERFKQRSAKIISRTHPVGGHNQNNKKERKQNMYQLVRHKVVEGEWEELDSFPSIEEAQSRLSSLSDAGEVYCFYVGEPTGDLEKSVAIFEEVNKANGGRIARATLGLDLCSAKRDASITSCPGRCFCVIAHGMRRCETYWCSASGWCWWVPCGMNC
jgi:hypothetical protein